MKKTVTIDTEILKAIIQAIHIAKSNGHWKLNGIDTVELMIKVSELAQMEQEPYKFRHTGSH